jgi:hypothetical protein
MYLQTLSYLFVFVTLASAQTDVDYQNGIIEQQRVANEQYRLHELELLEQQKQQLQGLVTGASVNAPSADAATAPTDSNTSAESDAQSDTSAANDNASAAAPTDSNTPDAPSDTSAPNANDEAASAVDQGADCMDEPVTTANQPNTTPFDC